MASPPLGLRKSGDFMAVSSAPSINKTPLGKDTPAVGYQVSADLSNSVGVVPFVTFNDQPACVLDQSSQPKCTGDEAGSAGGIRSGTCGGEVKPTSGSGFVWIDDKPALRVGDQCTLNNGNCPGVYVSVPPPEGDSARPVSLDSYEFDENAGERSLLDIHSELIGKLDIKALRHFKDGVNNALDGAVESSNYNPFVMAFCALGVALNEVFVPENLLDISPVKPLNLLKKGSKAAHVVKKGSDGLLVKGTSVKSGSLDLLSKNAKDMFNRYESNGWRGNVSGQNRGTSAGSKFANRDKKLPIKDGAGNTINYKEFDVNNKLPNGARDAERFIYGSDGSVYFTNDHYRTFTRIK